MDAAQAEMWDRAFASVGGWEQTVGSRCVPTLAVATASVPTLGAAATLASREIAVRWPSAQNNAREEVSASGAVAGACSVGWAKIARSS